MTDGAADKTPIDGAEKVIEYVTEMPVGYLILAVLAGVAIAALAFYVISLQPTPVVEYPPEQVSEDA